MYLEQMKESYFKMLTQKKLIFFSSYLLDNRFSKKLLFYLFDA